jgi:hypothetical protein
VVKCDRNVEQRGAMSCVSGLQKGKYAQTIVTGGSAVVIVMMRPCESERSQPGISQVNMGFTSVDFTAMRTPLLPAMELIAT